MPSVAYFTASAPFWDFIERLESSTDDAANPHSYRRRGRGCRRPENPPGDGQPEGSGSGAENQSGERQPGPHHHRGPHGMRGRGGCHGRGGFRGPQGPHEHPFAGPWGHGGPHHHRRGGPGFPFGGPFNPFAHRGGNWSFPWAATGAESSNDGLAGREFKPAVDLFTAADAYTLHFSLPGAKREDIGVVYDPAKSELVVSGVVHRPGDEEFLNTISSGFRERDGETGVFERKFRFGNRRWAADVNENAIAAKLEDGVLIVVLPRHPKADEAEKKHHVPVQTEDDAAETEEAEKEAFEEAQKHQPDLMDVESETEPGEDVDGDTLYSRDDKKNVTFEEEEVEEEASDSDEDFVDVKRVDVQ